MTVGGGEEVRNPLLPVENGELGLHCASNGCKHYVCHESKVINISIKYWQMTDQRSSIDQSCGDRSTVQVTSKSIM